ncbi:MAG TPA: hypothetical protein VJT33_03195 [bacterium]|nr:hypothetical protein [bacterium]
MRRSLAAILAAGLIAAAALPAPAAQTVVQFPVVAPDLIFFVASGFSAQPIILFGRPTVFPVILQPVLIRRRRAAIVPVALVVLSAEVPFGVSILPSVPMSAPPLYAPPTSSLPAASADTVGNIARAPELYNERLLSTTGTVSALGQFVDDWGHPYLMFRLTDGYRAILVLVGGQAPALRGGEPVQVTGLFYSEAATSRGRSEGILEALTVTGVP